MLLDKAIKMTYFFGKATKFLEMARRKKYWKNEFKNLWGEITRNKSDEKSVNDFYEKYGIKITPPYMSLIYKKFDVDGKYDFRYFIPDDFYYCVIDPFYNNWEEARYLDNKAYYSLYLGDIKQPDLLVTRMNGFWQPASLNVNISFDEVYLKVKNNNIFIKKATDSEGGHGIIVLDSGFTKMELIKAVEKINGDLIIQKGLTQIKVLSEINPSSVNTIRVLSMIRPSGKVKIYSRILRMGINGAKVDNASSGGITCGISSEGKLNECAYTARGDKYYEHPNSKVRFSEIAIPSLEKIEDIVMTVHPRFSHFRLLSWDFAIDGNEEPVLIEVNLRYGELDFHQFNNGPVFGGDTEEILAEVSGGSKLLKYFNKI